MTTLQPRRSLQVSLAHRAPSARLPIPTMWLRSARQRGGMASPSAKSGQFGNVAAPWNEIVALVEVEQPRTAMTPQTASNDHGWQAIFAAVAAENAVSSARPGGSNHGWDEAFLNAKS
jgi:hypothetical protein